ncbi:SDR family NAD(P)-dependent oxidoreductase [Aspergillus mulundensis]|uniref:Uncharacterized protein n=1 Tax=Aspergillus mulundensis TaxID=1810919 RepID=A0A3D8R4Q0_9EURO|nr:hypothetical protein DSM5745_08759 [Aspergillus mulundensis]RDW68999.1 hypothetical protein DSM5745_08759 [Aspergillus mulundensis]
MPSLETLSIGQGHLGISLTDVLLLEINNSKSPALKNLELFNIQNQRTSRVPLSYLQRPALVPVQTQNWPIYLAAPVRVPGHGDHAIRWPESLVDFTLTNYEQDEYQQEYHLDLPGICSMLANNHMDTLKAIKLGRLHSNGEGALFNASIFSQLESLSQLFWQVFGYAGFPKYTHEMGNNFFAPKLRVIELDFIKEEAFDDWTTSEYRAICIFNRPLTLPAAQAHAPIACACPTVRQPRIVASSFPRVPFSLHLQTLTIIIHTTINLTMSKTASPPCQVIGTAFITGGASGIGKSIAHAYAQNGISALALADISLASLETTNSELRAQYPQVQVLIYAVDVTNEDEIACAVQSAAEKFGRIDISIHGAGIGGVSSPTHELSLKDWQKVIDVNQTGVMLCDKWVIRQMLGQDLLPGYQGRGIIVNISSIYGVAAPHGRMGIAAYTAAKHAVIGLTRFDAKAYAKDGIRINAICPGFVDTPLTHATIEEGMLYPEIENTALKRPATPDEIANAVLFLTSRMGSYMCAGVLVVDGGTTA